MSGVGVNDGLNNFNYAVGDMNSEQFEAKQIQIVDGNILKEMISFAVEWFAKSESDVNVLNVFPVPDGDTGTNMLLTMRSSLDEANKVADPSSSSTAKAIAYGSLMGARGNSGVILSQIWRGIARSLQGKEETNGQDLAEAFQVAAVTAHEGLENPVEGTILTVIKEVANATSKYRERENESIVTVIQTAVDAAGKAVANTPNLLPVLKEAGVVDSGGQGLYILLEGALMYLKGQTSQLEFGKSKIIVPEGTSGTANISELREEVPFGYCTEFHLKGENLVLDKIRRKLKNQGQSLIVVGNESTLKIHIHSLDPSSVIRYALSLGTISSVQIRNMDEQYEDFVKTQKEKDPIAIAVIAVASGDGIMDVFHKIGATSIISGGKTMNPCTKDILHAVEAAPSDQVIILPNDKNLTLVAQQVAALSKKNVQVLPSATIPQGVAALLSFNPQTDLQTNIGLMNEARLLVKTVEVTRATRSTRINGFNIQKDQAIGLLDGKLMAVNDTTSGVVVDILSKIDLCGSETVSIYCRNNTAKIEARKIRELIFQKNPRLNIDILQGGQPLYDFLISIE
jgi:DAK2 domain fusion protein YloV